jgi:hypothetical protein
LNVPISRLETENNFNLGRASEITRDELQFNRFVDSLRNRFRALFDDILRTQLILKGILKSEDWEEIKDKIVYVWTEDSFFSELKNSEIMQERINLLGQVEPYIEKYYSEEWVRKNILMQTEEEIERLEKEREEDAKKREAEEKKMNGGEGGENGGDGGFENDPQVSFSEPPKFGGNANNNNNNSNPKKAG